MAENRKNRTFSILLIVLLLIFAGQTLALAAETDNVKDYLNYLNEDQLKDVQAAIDDAVTEYQLDLVIVITDKTDGKSSRDYADDFYDYNGFGIGNDYSGLLMLINMDIREVWISTTGKAISIFDDNRINAMLDAVYPYLSDAEYYKACMEFVSQTEYYAAKGPDRQGGSSGNPGSIGNDIGVPYTPGYPQQSQSRGYLDKAVGIMSSPALYITGLIIAIVATAIASTSNKGKNNITNRTYEEKGSFQLTGTADDFIRETTTRVRVTSNTTGSSGGSRTHTSSSGRSHGGGGRRF